MLERGSKTFVCFLDVQKASDTVWIDGLLYKLFHEFDIRGRMWFALKVLYTDITAQVLYDCSFSRIFDVLQGTGQGRIVALFMYKVHIHDLLTEINNHSFAIVINRVTLSGPSLADDISFLRYEFNHTKSGTVTFGEDKRKHCTRMNEREWELGLQIVDELSEYKSLGVTKNYIGSSVSDVNDNIEKTKKKAGMIFSPILIAARRIHLFMLSSGSRLVFHLFYLEQNLCQSLLVYFRNLNDVKAGFSKMCFLY